MSPPPPAPPVLVAALLVAATDALAEGRLSLTWSAPDLCVDEAPLVAALTTRLRDARLQEDITAAANVTGGGDRWQLTLRIRRGGVSVSTTHDASSCRALAVITLEHTLREARGVAAGPIDARPVDEVPGDAREQAQRPNVPRPRYDCRDVLICPGEEFGLAVGTAAVFRYDDNRARRDPLEARVSFHASVWSSDDWAFGVTLHLPAFTAGVGIEPRISRRLFGESPLEAGFRAIAHLGFGWYAFDPDALREREQVGIRPGLRGEASLGMFFAWMEANLLVTPTLVQVDGFAGIGLRFLERAGAYGP